MLRLCLLLLFFAAQALLGNSQPLSSEELALALSPANELDGTLAYVALSASHDEWNATFGSAAEEAPGVLHIWMRCLEFEDASTPLLRGFAFMESVDYLRGVHWHERRKTWAAQQQVSLKDVTFVVNGSAARLTSWDQTSGTIFMAPLQRGWSAGDTVTVSVLNWAAYFTFPLDSCATAQTPRPPRRLRVTSLHYDSVAPPLMYRAVAMHALYYRDTFDAVAYELIAPRSAVARLLQDPTLAALHRAGYFRVLLKPSRPPPLSGSGGFEWQAVHNNVAALRAWERSETVLYVDADEYLVFSRSVPRFWAASGVVITCRDVYCTNCSAAAGDADSLLRSQPAAWVMDVDAKVYLPPKFAAVPSQAGVMYVHHLDAGPKRVDLQEADGFIWHFHDLLRRRRTDDSASAVPVTLPEAIVNAAKAAQT